jgi:hypothetical protein
MATKKAAPKKHRDYPKSVSGQQDDGQLIHLDERHPVPQDETDNAVGIDTRTDQEK